MLRDILLTRNDLEIFSIQLVMVKTLRHKGCVTPDKTDFLYA